MVGTRETLRVGLAVGVRVLSVAVDVSVQLGVTRSVADPVPEAERLQLVVVVRVCPGVADRVGVHVPVPVVLTVAGVWLAVRTRVGLPVRDGSVALRLSVHEEVALPGLPVLLQVRVKLALWLPVPLPLREPAVAVQVTVVETEKDPVRLQVAVWRGVAEGLGLRLGRLQVGVELREDVRVTEMVALRGEGVWVQVRLSPREREREGLWEPAVPVERVAEGL